jgi:hypothetical protein
MAIAGLATQLGMQAFINMGVNLISADQGHDAAVHLYGGSALCRRGDDGLPAGAFAALARPAGDPGAAPGDACEA